ncbi:hypothetical protein [Collimonas silvisoli]|uniref:hypothetical protein n=1 Tax=Collimonas silvisoli TaxID=2825884 RepID=UPI001B8B2753|nr:hypothetical protein [Collimonas silvisoli]
MKSITKAACAAIFLAVLTGCASPKLTVDDGRKLDEKLLVEMKIYGSGATAIRPAIVKTAALHDKNCSIQFELPFEVLTSYGLKDDVKVAWVRTLGVHENLSVIATDGSVNLSVGDVVTEVDSYKNSDTPKMLDKLMELRDSGRPFKLTLASGKELTITPVTVCRGHVLVAPPFAAATQTYHWTAVVHPQEVFRQPLTPDEAAWVVLWTQGLSEEGGARMKTYSYFVGTVKWVGIVASVATGGAALAAGGATAAASAGQFAGGLMAGKAADVVTGAAVNKGSLSGINGVAGGVFDKADKWAFEHIKKLGMNPRAGLTLHEKMVQAGTVGNAFALDEARLAKMKALIAQLPQEPRVIQASPVGTVHADSAVTRAGSLKTASPISPANSAIAPVDERSVETLDVRDVPAE